MSGGRRRRRRRAPKARKGAQARCAERARRRPRHRAARTSRRPDARPRVSPRPGAAGSGQGPPGPDLRAGAPAPPSSAPRAPPASQVWRGRWPAEREGAGWARGPVPAPARFPRPAASRPPPSLSPESASTRRGVGGGQGSWPPSGFLRASARGLVAGPSDRWGGRAGREPTCQSGRRLLGVLAARGPAAARGLPRSVVPKLGALCLGGACGQTGPARPGGVSLTAAPYSAKGLGSGPSASGSCWWPQGALPFGEVT